MNGRHWIDPGELDELARIDSPVHRLDPRAKILVTALYIVVVMSVSPDRIAALMPFVLFPSLGLGIAGIPVTPIIRRLAIALPFAAMIGALNLVVDREIAGTIVGIGLTGGVISFASILIRAVLTVSAALLLVSVTGMHRIGAGLAMMGVPGIFVTQVLFLVRYLFVISDEAVSMRRAVDLRSAGNRPGLSRGLPMRLYGSLLGNLLVRSLDRAVRVHRAMRARGFTGAVRHAGVLRFRGMDWVFLGSCSAVLIALRWADPAQWLGGVIAGGR